ncbi:MAG: myosin kinase, partial [Saprospiraceae bacterium]|nr:myosin kinase [Saprospiraceae bacterium]
MKHLLFLLLILLAAPCRAQNAPCSEYATIVGKLEKTFQNGKGNLDECLDLVESLRACDPNKSEFAGTWTKKIFAAIKKQKQDALDATSKAKKAQARADATALEAQRTARRAYANDLAYKSQTALRDGDRTTAYRLAEFAHRYVDDDNQSVTRALVEALYYNDVPDTTHRLPWAANLQGHTYSVLSVAFSPDGTRLATGSSDNTAKIWDLNTGKAALTLEGHTHYVRSVAFSPDGTRLATGSDDKTAKIWDL